MLTGGLLASFLAAPTFAYTVDPGPIVNPVPISIPPNVNYIVNGGFESNAGSPWWLSGSNATIDKVAHRGCWSLRLGGYGNGSAFYRLNLPATASEGKTQLLAPGAVQRRGVSRSDDVKCRAERAERASLV